MKTPAIRMKKSVREHVSEEEWDRRVNLAACYRLMDMFGMTEMVVNHITTRVPGEPSAFLINPYGLLYDQMTASCFIKIDLDGNELYNPGEYQVNRAGT